MTVDIYETINNNIYNFPKKLPYITVSSKGISNGLSTIINDGADFGPDTYLGATTKNRYGPPYTQTSGIQEAFNYAASIARPSFTTGNNNGYILPPVHLTTGKFVLNADFNLPLFTNNPQAELPSFLLEGEGGNYYDSGTEIVLNGYNFYIGTPNQNQNNNGGFIIRDLGFTGAGNTNGNVFIQGFDVDNMYIIQNVGLNCGLYMDSWQNPYQVLIENVGAYEITLPSATQLTLNNVWSATGTWIKSTQNQISQINASSIAETLIIGWANLNTQVHFQSWISDYNIAGGSGPYVIANYIPPGYSSTLDLIVDNLMLFQGSSTSYQQFWGGFGTNHGTLNLKLHIKNLLLNGFTDFTLPSTGLNLLQFEIDEITNVSGQSLTSLPIYINANGTTAGTISGRYINYRTNYKKIIFTFSGYENDTTTNQTINFPLPFNTSAIISANNTGLTISTTTSGITITAPNSTTTYNGIVIIEGY